MSLSASAVSLEHLTAWTTPLRRLAGDQRTETLLVGVLAGILGSGSLVCRQVAAFSPTAGGVDPWRAPDSPHAPR